MMRTCVVCAFHETGKICEVGPRLPVKRPFLFFWKTSASSKSVKLATVSILMSMRMTLEDMYTSICTCIYICKPRIYTYICVCICTHANKVSLYLYIFISYLFAHTCTYTHIYNKHMHVARMEHSFIMFG